MNVILQGDGKPFGVLEVDSRSEGEFGEHDIAFLQGAANLLGMAIERQRIEASLRGRGRAARDPAAGDGPPGQEQPAAGREHAAPAGQRGRGRGCAPAAAGCVAAGSPPIARAHHRLYRGDQVRTIDLGGYLDDLCGDLQASAGECRIDDRPARAGSRSPPTGRSRWRWWSPSWSPTPPSMPIPTAWPDRIRVRLVARWTPARHRVCRWRMTGVGLPPGFDPSASRGPRHADRTGPGEAGRRRARRCAPAIPAPSSPWPCQPALPTKAGDAAPYRRTDDRSPQSPAGRAHAGHAGRRQPVGRYFRRLAAGADGHRGRYGGLHPRRRPSRDDRRGRDDLPPAGGRGRHRQLLRGGGPGRPDARSPCTSRPGPSEAGRARRSW